MESSRSRTPTFVSAARQNVAPTKHKSCCNWKKDTGSKCAKVLKHSPCFQRVGDAVSNRFLYVHADQILPGLEDITLVNAGKLVRVAIALIDEANPEAVRCLAEFLMETEREEPVVNPRTLLKNVGGHLSCERDGDEWVATASMNSVMGFKEFQARSNFKWAAEEEAAVKVIESDPLCPFYNVYPRACQYFQTFDGAWFESSPYRCPTCGETCDDLESLLDHMENNPYGFDECADIKNGLDWDACGISHETGEFMWGND